MKTQPLKASRPISASSSRTRRSISEDATLQPWRLKRAFVFIEAHLCGQVPLLALATCAGLSPMHFASQFRAATGVRPHEYVMRRKIEEVQLLLLTTRRTLIDIGTSFGFLTRSHFTTVFKRFVGEPPLRWQQRRLRQLASALFRLCQLQKKHPVSTAMPLPAMIRNHTI